LDGIARGHVRARDRPRRLLEPLQRWLRCLLHPVEQLRQLAHPEGHPVKGLEVGANAAEGQARRGPQGGDQAGEAHADAPLPADLPAQVAVRRLPAPTPATPTFDHLMLDYYDGLRRGQLDHLASAGCGTRRL